MINHAEMMVWQQGWWAGALRRDSPNFAPRPAGEAVSLAVIHNISLPPFVYGGDAVEALFTNRIAADEEPESHHLKDSGSGEEDSDLILLLSANEEDEANNRLNINVAKQRQGSKFKLSSKTDNPVYFDRSKMIIGDSPRGLEY